MKDNDDKDAMADAAAMPSPKPRPRPSSVTNLSFHPKTPTNVKIELEEAYHIDSPVDSPPHSMISSAL